MKLIDLTHVLENEMPVFPGTAEPIFSTAYTVKENGFKETMMEMLTHTGTHLDCPAHFIENGETTDTVTIDNFAGKAWVCNLHTVNISHEKSVEEILNLPEDFRPEYILFRTNHNQFWKKPEYFHPFLTPENSFIERLIAFGIKGVGIDTISIDPMDSTTYPNHYSLLGNNKIIVENLKNLDQLEGKKLRFYAFPLKVKEGDGSPIRAVAEILD